jgi:hypothetical protein
MNKKMLTLLAAAWVGFVLIGPTSAAAASPDIDFSKANPHFVSAGGTSLLTFGFGVNCTSISSQGQWTTEGAQNTGSTGTAKITFKGCLVLGSVACTSPGAAAGEIRSEELVFHLVYIKGSLGHTVGMLFTNNATTGRFAETSCGNVTGNGLIAHLGSPACWKTSKTLTTTFESSSSGVSRYQEIEGSSTKYHWLSGTNEASADSQATITLEPEVTATLTCP